MVPTARLPFSTTMLPEKPTQGLEPESVEELAALLRKGDPVTIEQ
jgi:hypothetical protein